MLLLRQHPDTDAALQAVGSMLVRATTMMTLKGGSLLTILLVLSGHGHSLGLTWVYFGGFFVLLVHQFGQRAGSCFVLRGYTTSTFLHPPCIPLQRGGCYICLTCKWFYSQKVESEQDGKLERQKLEYGHFRFWEAIFFHLVLQSLVFPTFTSSQLLVLNYGCFLSFKWLARSAW